MGLYSPQIPLGPTGLQIITVIILYLSGDKSISRTRKRVRRGWEWPVCDGSGLTSGMAGNRGLQTACDCEQPLPKSHGDVCQHLNKRTAPASVEIMGFKVMMK